jgi:hypothetical protein
VGCDLAVLDSLCMPAFANHALVTGRTQGLEKTCELLRAATHDLHPGRVGEVLAEGDIVVQFGTRELTSPGGAFLGYEALAETAIRDLALPADLSMAALAIRDLTMLRQLGALHLYRVAQAGVSAAR